MTPPSIIYRVSPSLPRLQSLLPSLHSLLPLTLDLSPPISADRDYAIHSLSSLSLSLSPPISVATPPCNLFLETHPPLPTPLLCRPHPRLWNWALNDWKILVRKGVRKQRNYETLIDIDRCPLQEGYVECGYFVLAFMREITLTFDGLSLLQTKDIYIDIDMSIVRQ
ncbi:hypothetical protein TIFTF001_036777 [Ficus carica]|uniref:Ubiquitin-like protease family profile domain-containing protein n=1 Tax=Ficus carica TaxID=3494 RepID=A0AA88JD38_FICCA|nr:hypothetical protein TIFTF001_036776 [Ficus carica]GMN67719.1 hypothetical protein TIFTF001_036777 [Ficus carica]